MANEPTVVSFSLTHVHYNPDDRLSYLSAWLALVPQGLCVAYTALIWATREAEIALMFAGQLGCEALNWCLKRLIKEERPKQMYGKGYGMPSSHAQFAAYFATYLALFLLVRHRPARPVPSSARRRHFTAAFALVLAAAIALSRVYLSYHTPRQVAAGSLAGTLCGAAWFGAVGALRAWGILDWALGLPPARWLRARDLVVREELWDAGWERWEAGRSGRGRGKVEGKMR